MANEEMTLTQAAERFKVNRRTLAYAAKAGTLKARRVGAFWLTTPAAVGEWIASEKHIPGRAPKRRGRRGVGDSAAA